MIQTTTFNISINHGLVSRGYTEKYIILDPFPKEEEPILRGFGGPGRIRTCDLAD